MKKRYIVYFILIVISVILIIRLLKRNTGLEGVSYIQKQEELSVDEISDVLKERNKQEKQIAIEEGKLDVFAYIDDYVFYGDSRVMGFYGSGFMDQSDVFAQSGNSLANVDDWNENLKNKMPSTVFIAYGINDMGQDLNNEYDGGYKKLAIDKMNLILSIDPNAKIYYCAIIPCSPAALERAPAWAQIDTYNEAIKEACEAVDACTYVDDAYLADGGNANIYSDEGIHFTTSFYPVWMQTIVETMD